MLKNIMIITNRLIITVLSLIIVTVLIFNRTSGSQFGGAEVAPIAPPPVAPVAPVAPSSPIAPIAPVASAPPPPPPDVYIPPPVVIEKFKIGNRNFALAPYGFSPIIYYEDGTVRSINTEQYAFRDVKNGVTKSYSIFSLNNPKSVSLDRLNDNLTYFIMFPQDLALAKNLKKLKSPVLNKMIDYFYTSTTYGQAGSLNFGGRPPVKIVKTGSSTAVLVDPMRQDLYYLSLIKKGDTWDFSKSKRVNTWDVNETWDFNKRAANSESEREDWTRPSVGARDRFLELNLRSIKQKTKYKCNTDEGAQEFLTDLAFFPELSGCPYESLS